MEILEAIDRKRAVREYTQAPIDDHIAKIILQAGRRAQSSCNKQPWSFIAVRDRQMLERLATTGNYAAHVASAGLLVVIVLPDPAENPAYLFDAGQAAAIMQLAAMEFSIGSCVVKLHHSERAKDLLNIPSDRHVIYAIAFGYPLDPMSLTSATKNNGRKPFHEIVHWDKW